MKNAIFAFLVGCSLLPSAYAFEAKSFLPENNLHLQDSLLATGGIDEVTFNEVIDVFEAAYAPIFQELGGTLNVNRNWSNATVNAYADRSDGKWNISMFGGLARRSEITRLGFMLVVCHEAAHHMGGYPLYTGDRWASIEGNSDYVGMACMKKLLAGSYFEVATPSKTATAKCKQIYKDQDLDVCYSLLSAGESTAGLLAALGGQKKPSYSTPDKSVVKRTYEPHPKGQCRLDTYLAGALCDVKWDDSVIPKKNDYLKYSCATGLGARPKCWFKP